MRNSIGIIGTIAGFVQFGITFFVLLEIKGLFFTLGSIFIFPVFASFPVWGYFIWGYSNPLLTITFFTLLAGGIMEAKSRGSF